MYAQVSDKPRAIAKDTLKYITGFFFDGFVICSDHRLLYGILHTHKLCSFLIFCRPGSFTFVASIPALTSKKRSGSKKSHFNVSLIVRDKVTRQCPQTTTFGEKGEPKRNRTDVTSRSAYQPNALPLSQTALSSQCSASPK